MLSMMRFVVSAIFCVAFVTTMAHAQSQTPPDISGSWGPNRGGRGADPKLAPPPASPIVLKPEYAQPYAARRAAEAEATKLGEPLATSGSLCVPYGMPSMMSVAVYP